MGKSRFLVDMLNHVQFALFFFSYILWPLFFSLHFTLDSLPLRGISADWTIKEGAAISLLTPLPGTKAKHASFMVSNKKYWLCYIRQRKENVVLPSATNTIQKIKFRKSLTKSTKFCLDWTFFFFKWRKKHPNLVLLDALKIITKKYYFPSNRPNFTEIPLEGNTTNFSFW